MNTTDAEQIHLASLAILEDTGIRLEHDGIVAKLLKAGAKPGTGPQDVKLPTAFVMDMVRQAPPRIRIADRVSDGYDLTPQSESRVWSTPGLKLWRKGEARLFRAADMAAAARLLDRLPTVDGVFGMAMDDVPPAARDIVGLRIMAENTRKHIRVLCFTPRGAELLCRMKPVVSDKPWFSIGFTAHGPLRWTRLALDIFEKTAGHGIPTSINGEPMAGVSGPVTLAGSAAVGNAEILAGIVVNQVLEPGRPCIYNLGLAHVFDMKHASAVTGGPENHLLADASAAMGRFYNLPSCSWVSTESPCPDGQAALEKSIGFTTHQQSGVSLIWGIGQLESEMAFSPAQAVIDDEILRYLRRYRRGVPVTPDTLALQVIKSTGISGDYLSHEHTLDNFRTELFEPELLFRQRREVWEAGGRTTLNDRAEARADELLKNPLVPCLTDGQQKELKSIETEYLSTL